MLTFLASLVVVIISIIVIIDNVYLRCAGGRE